MVLQVLSAVRDGFVVRADDLQHRLVGELVASVRDHQEITVSALAADPHAIYLTLAYGERRVTRGFLHGRTFPPPTVQAEWERQLRAINHAGPLGARLLLEELRRDAGAAERVAELLQLQDLSHQLHALGRRLQSGEAAQAEELGDVLRGHTQQLLASAVPSRELLAAKLVQAHRVGVLTPEQVEALPADLREAPAQVLVERLLGARVPVFLAPSPAPAPVPGRQQQQQQQDPCQAWQVLRAGVLLRGRKRVREEGEEEEL